ncbi:MAG: hypothetical protein K2L12_06260 [Clostridia bacterium]|nr:hypothetical protein [Clostridia bacterium]
MPKVLENVSAKELINGYTEEKGVQVRSVPVQGIQVLSVTAQGISVHNVPVQGIPVQGIPVRSLAVQGIPVHNVPVQGTPVQSVSVHEEPRRSKSNIRRLKKQLEGLRGQVGVLTYNQQLNEYETILKNSICNKLRQQEVNETFINQEVTDRFVQSCISNNLTVDEAIAILLF